jgi:hypothetical protein
MLSATSTFDVCTSEIIVKERKGQMREYTVEQNYVFMLELDVPKFERTVSLIGVIL